MTLSKVLPLVQFDGGAAPDLRVAPARSQQMHQDEAWSLRPDLGGPPQVLPRWDALRGDSRVKASADEFRGSL